jgi:ligand-binding sensor domain-containing protein
MLQDSLGYMWFATENGVSRFDGYSFTNFTKDDGLPTNSTLKLYEDYKGRIWFLSYEGSISYFDGQNITVHPLFRNIISPDVLFFDNIYIDILDRISLSGFKKNRYLVENNKITTLDSTAFGILPRTVYMYYENKGNDKILGFANPVKGIENQEIHPQREGLTIRFNNTGRFAWSQKHSVLTRENQLLISLGMEIKWVEGLEVINKMQFSNNIIGLFEDLDGNIWISEEFNGIAMYPKGDISANPIHFLQSNSCSEILQDYEGNYWFSTTENGVFWVPSIHFLTYDKKNLPIISDVILSMEASGKFLFFSTGNRGFYKSIFKPEGLEVLDDFNLEGSISSNINDLLVSSDGNLWITNSEYLAYDLNGKSLNFSSNFRHAGYEICELADQTILLSMPSGYKKFERGKLVYSSFEGDFKYRTFALHAPDDSTIFFGTIDGLFKLSNNKYKRFLTGDPVLNSRISDIQSIDTEIWVGTFDNGIAVIDGDEIRYINAENGLSSNRIKVLRIDTDGSVWVGTNKGLNHIVADPYETWKCQFRHYSIWNGLPTNEINDILIREDRIWLATDQGIVNFNPLGLNQNVQPPKLLIEQVWVNEMPLSENTSHEFGYNENNIRFDFKALSFINPGQVYYEYNLSGLDDRWIGTENPSVRFPALEPGRYTFSVKAENYLKSWSDVITFGFTIRKHFSQTIWFQIMLLTGFLGLTFLVFYWILLTQRRRESLRQQIVLAEQKAVRSQMNPHFIFNSLNSIQHFIIDRDEKKADSYLSKFSKLIRKILDSSKFNTISLNEEVETLRLYLQLEQLRFGDRFDYEIEIDSRINPEEANIPTMILQPIIENAIWHGLMPKKTAGKLLIRFELITDKKIKVIVHDNGIGREKSAKINEKRKHHNPMGIENIMERLALLNQLNKTDMSLEIIDLHDENHQPSGTLVEIVLEF